MVREIFEKKEKKVEYIELIYDLIFVYMIGRSNSLLHHIEGGFIRTPVFLSYILCTLAVIQIWMYTTYYINIYGKNGPREYIFMFINMFLIYFMAQGTRQDWQSYHTSYHVAWVLILLNIAAQYCIELYNHRGDKARLSGIKRTLIVLLGEAVLAGAAIFEFNSFGTGNLSWAAVLLSILAINILNRGEKGDTVDFEHLSERAMLFVVFTFGEMIIAIASYFDDGFSLNNLYFAFMAFLIVVGLFLSYGVIYDKMVDRTMQTNGLGYMLIHVFLIFALCGITAALEFMREPEIDLMPKVIFLIISFVIYYVFLFMTGIYAKRRCHLNTRFYFTVGGLYAVFIVLMILLREQMALNIAISVAFVFSIYAILYFAAKKMNTDE